MVSFALLFENYDYSLLGAALKDIAVDLQIPENQLGFFSSAIRLGALPALFIIPLSDSFGRRRLFLISIFGLGLGTFATAFSQNETQFVVLQVLTRVSMLVAGALAVVIVTEEYPAEHRGWGMGMIAAVGSVGHGLGALLFALIDVLPYGWRALYAIGVMPVLLLPLFRRGIRETRRFEQHRDQRDAATAGGWLRPLRLIARDHPARALTVIAIAGCSAAGTAVVFAFIGYFVRTVHGWEPWQYSAMVIVCGAVGVIGNVIGGRLADRYGRRVVGFGVFALFPLFGWMFFRGPAWSLPIVWIALVVTALAAGVIARALATELFPTEQRGTSAGLMVLAETLGAGLSLSVLSLLSDHQGDLLAWVPPVSMISFVAAGAILLLPETSQRELEVISGSAGVSDGAKPEKGDLE